MAASSRDAYHYLVNIDEYPEALSLAHEVIRDELTGIDDVWARLAAHRFTRGCSARSAPSASR